MGKVEIKIRKKILTPDNLQQYRNYPALLKKYERNKRFKRALRIFLYSLALTILVLALIFLGMWKVLLDKEQESNSKSKTYTYALIHRGFLNPDPGRIDTVIRRNVNNVHTDTFYVASYRVNENDTTFIKLPIKSEYNSKSIYWLDEKIFKTDQGNFKVVKYLYDIDIAADEEILYFYSPEYGIILEESIWGSYIQLIDTGNSKWDQNIYQLTKAIQADSVFFTQWQP